MKIAVVTPKMAGGERGGAENLYEGLVNALNVAGHTATQIKVVVDESTFESILEAYCNCFYLDLNDYDLVISTKAPTYMVRHRNHISYLLHTIRVFYDMFDVEFNPKDKENLKQRKLIHKFDKYGLHPSRTKKHCVIGETVAKRFKDADPFWNPINFEVIYPASTISDFNEPKEGEFIFLPGRLHRWKRVDLVIKAMKYVPYDVKLLIAGKGEDAEELKKLVKHLKLEDKIEFLGLVSDDELLELYSRSIVVPYTPKSEDFGYITLEAFKSKKPVITCYDSGEPPYIVNDRLSGFVVEPDPKKIAEKINYFMANPDEAKRMGENGYNSVQDVTWENATKKILDVPSVPPNQSNLNTKKMLVTDNQILDPPIGGGRVRIYELYKNFDPSAFDITYLGTFDWLGPEEREQKLAEHFKEIVVPMSVPHITIDKIFSRLCKGKTTLDVTVPWLMKFTKKYYRKLSKLIKEMDVVVIAHPWVYPYVKTEIKNLDRKPLLIYDSQNIEYQIKKDILSDTPLGKILAHKVKKVEGELVKNCDLIFACSDEDAQGFSDLYGVDEKKILVIPNGASVQDVPIPNTEEKESMRNYFGLEKKPTAIFLASGGYEPNDNAAEHICLKLAPLLRDITFVLVGSVCEIILNKQHNQLPENIKLMGVVSKDDKKKILYAADLALNPVTKGSGTNIKVFDYLAAGLPLVTTPVGARGIDFTNDEDVVIAEIAKFPEVIKMLINNDALRNSISKKGRELAEKYDWSAIAKIAENGIMNLAGGFR
jgi:glycosyltransferase involved in cell wall biosynthesis